MRPVAVPSTLPTTVYLTPRLQQQARIRWRHAQLRRIAGVLVVSVGADAPRAEVTIIERSTELLGPFAARLLQTDDEPPSTLPPPRFRPTPDAPNARATLREGDKATLPRGPLPL
jgi:hypothetical protein